MRLLVLAAVAVVLAGCGQLRSSAPAEPGERAHDAAVADLRERVAAEEGWLVLELPNEHEGGGHTTWWLHPCDPDADAGRAVTRTAFHGSDVATLPGQYTVEESRVPCAPPRRTVVVAGRELGLDAAVVALDGLFGLVAPREEVTVTEGAVEHVLDSGEGVAGACDGWTAWSARMVGDAAVSFAAADCAGTVGALPEPARRLLDGADDLDRGSWAPLRGDAAALGAALEAAGWAARPIRATTFEGTTVETLWVGPCGAGADGGPVRTNVDVVDGGARTSARPCDS